MAGGRAAPGLSPARLANHSSKIRLNCSLNFRPLALHTARNFSFSSGETHMFSGTCFRFTVVNIP